MMMPDTAGRTKSGLGLRTLLEAIAPREMRQDEAWLAKAPSEQPRHTSASAQRAVLSAPPEANESMATRGGVASPGPFCEGDL